VSTIVHQSTQRTQRTPVLSAAKRLPHPAFFLNHLKRPTCPNGFYDACQGDALDELYARHPGPLIGVPTGPASGLAVLDIDTAKGGDVWWSENKGKLPKTRLHDTRSGGIHGLFRHRDGLKCSTSKIAVGVDVRGESGYVAWWPAAGFSVVDHPLADWPDWLLPPDPPSPPPRPAVPAALLPHSRADHDTAARLSIEHVLP
jgi:bifunctional DNA primase/polymerase-like protein